VATSSRAGGSNELIDDGGPCIQALLMFLPLAHKGSRGALKNARCAGRLKDWTGYALNMTVSLSKGLVRHPLGSSVLTLALAFFAFCLPCCHLVVRVILTRPTSHTADTVSVFAPAQLPSAFRGSPILSWHTW
jgi:hypothetical protein